MNSHEIATAITSLFDERDVQYYYSLDDSQVIILPNQSVQSKLSSADIVINIYEDYFAIFTFSKITVKACYQDEVIRYLNLINSNRIIGCFSLELSKGQIAWRYTFNCIDIPKLTPGVFFAALSFSLQEFSNFGDGLVALAMGFSDYETEFNKAMEKILAE